MEGITNLSSAELSQNMVKYYFSTLITLCMYILMSVYLFIFFFMLCTTNFISLYKNRYQ